MIEPNALSLLIVDDEEKLARLLEKELGRLGFRTACCHDGASALARVDEEEVDVVLLDLKLPDRSGLEILGELKRRDPLVEVILMTGHGSLDSAIEAMRQGAYDYLTKPCKLDELAVLVQKAAEKQAAFRENRSLRRVLAREGEAELVGESASMKQIQSLIEKVARATDVPVLITGESGTGKELVARAVHRHSPVASGPFVAVNCAALQSSLLESEIFGHEKGAFTGATERKDGIVEAARGGTLFLDEIGEIAEEVQAKLLRFIQFGEFRRVGGTQTKKVSLRIVAATNRDLREEIKEGRFREDLFYRLNVAQIHLPPLRERPEDVGPLADRFVALHAASPCRIEPDARALLAQYPWPGNVRELENFIRRLLIFLPGETISARDVREAFQGMGLDTEVLPSSLVLADVTRTHILKVLRLCDGNKTRAAKTLGIALKTLYNKLAEYGEHTPASE